jgi:hypothetical protein
MVQDAQVARHDLVLQDRARRYVDTVTVVGNNDHSTLFKKKKKTEKSLFELKILNSIKNRYPYAQSDALAERDITRHGQVVKLETVRDAAEAFQKLVDLFKYLISFKEKSFSTCLHRYMYIMHFC